MINLRAPLIVVDGDISVGLEKAHLAFALDRYAAGGDIGDATVLKGNARIGDVRHFGQHRHPHRFDPQNRRAHQADNDIDVVNHQIQDHIDIGAALDERRQAVTFDELRILDDAFEAANRRIEPFQMADLQ